MFKILHFVDKKMFGNQVLVYRGKNKNEDVYFVIIKDREETVFFLLDSNLEKMYCMNSHISLQKFDINFQNAPEHLDIIFDIDLSKYGYSKCSDFLVELIRGST